MPERSWRLIRSEPVSDHRIFRLRHDVYRLDARPDERDFVVLETPDWVNVVALTEDRQVLLIRQFRHGVRRVTLEIPGGMIDPGESPEQAALRELREETGYAAGTIRPLGRVLPNPAIQDNYCHLFLADGCRRVAELQLDPFERIDLLIRPLDDIPWMIQRGEIDHTMVINAFAFLGLVPPRVEGMRGRDEG